MTGCGEMTRIAPRTCGGWIGVFDDGWLRYAVTAPSEAATRAALAEASARWRGLAAEGEPSSSHATATGAACRQP